MADRPFRPEDCTELVFYAVDRLEEEPVPGTPSFVARGIPRAVFIADVAPYLTEITRDEVIGMAREAAEAAPDPPALRALLAWVEGSGKECFLFQREPPAIAGDGTARRSG